MDEFNDYFLNKFGKSVWELSSSDFGNKFLDYDFQMISWDDVSKFFQENNDHGFNDRFSTADGLLFLNKNGKIQTFFFEFKNIDYSNLKDRQMAKYYLNEYLKK